MCDLLPTRVRALMRWDPDAVLVGAAAAWVSFWPEIRISCISCSLKHQHRQQPGYEFTRRRIPAELVVSRAGLRLTSPALTALDLCPTVGGDAIDQALWTQGAGSDRDADGHGLLNVRTAWDRCAIRRLPGPRHVPPQALRSLR